MITLDKNSHIKAYSPVCTLCKHFQRDSWPIGEHPACAAFAQIPLEIWDGKNNHQQPYPGDNGIQYERVGTEDAQ